MMEFSFVPVSLLNRYLRIYIPTTASNYSNHKFRLEQATNHPSIQIDPDSSALSKSLHLTGQSKSLI